jgi:hypothetical protein
MWQVRHSLRMGRHTQHSKPLRGCQRCPMCTQPHTRILSAAAWSNLDPAVLWIHGFCV